MKDAKIEVVWESKIVLSSDMKPVRKTVFHVHGHDKVEKRLGTDEMKWKIMQKYPTAKYDGSWHIYDETLPIEATKEEIGTMAEKIAQDIKSMLRDSKDYFGRYEVIVE